MTMRYRSITSMLALVLLAACSGDAGPTLQGAWSGTDSLGSPVTLVLTEGGTALWVEDRIPGVRDTFALRYRVDSTAAPGHLTLSGFRGGDMAGMTLYGIYELRSSDTLRADFEAGLPGQRGVRPDSFTVSTILFTRTR